MIAVHVLIGAFIALFYFALAAFAQIRSYSYHRDWYFFVMVYSAGVVSLLYYFLYIGVFIYAPYEFFRGGTMALLGGILCFGYYYNKKWPIKKEILKKYPRSFFLNFDRRFITAKTFDILFQNIVIVGTVLLLATVAPAHSTVVIFGGLFFFAHFFLVVLQGKASSFHLGGSLIAGLIFPLLILFVPGGGYIMFALHFSGYVVGRMMAPHFLK